MVWPLSDSVLPKRGVAGFAGISFSSFGFLPKLSDSVSGEFVSQLNEVMALIYKGTHNILLEATNAQ